MMRIDRANSAGWVVLAVLAAVALGCSYTVTVPTLNSGPTQTATINEAAPSGGAADVTIKMGAGTLQLAGGASGLAQGEIKYNVPDWKPVITRNGNVLEISQRSSDVRGVPTGNVVNDWNIKLGSAPMNLTLQMGAYKGSIDLGGLHLRGLNISDGASQGEVKFSAPNPEQMAELSYKSGASSATVTGLGNANFAHMTFEGGAGSYTLDFTGNLQRDATVDLKTGVSSTTLQVPASTATRVVVSGGLSNIKTQGTWTVNGQTYSLGGQGKTLTINVEMGVGNLNLVAR